MITLMVVTVIYLSLLVRLALSQNARQPVHAALAVALSMLILWILAVFGLQIQAGQQVAYARMVFQVGLLALASLVWLVATVVGRGKVVRPVRRLCAVVVVGSLACWTPWMITALERRDGIPLPLYGVLAWLYVGLVLVCTVAIMILLARGVSRGSVQHRTQVRTIGASLLVAITIASMTNLVLPALMNDANTALLLPIAILVLATGLSYAIIRQGFLELKAVAVRSAAYTLSIVTLAAAYFALAYILSITLLGQHTTHTGISTSPANIALALVIALLFQPVKQFFDRATDRLFYRYEYDRDNFFAELGNLLAHTTDMRLLLRRTSLFLGHVFKVERVALVARHGVSLRLAGNQRTAALHIPRADIVTMIELAERSGGYNRVIRAEATDNHALADIMRIHEIVLMMPLALQDEVVGCLFMGEHGGRGYSKRDLSLLESASGELVIALNNALSIEAVQELNQSLRQRIEDATKELRASNRQLQKLDEAKNEFISMASHQLRTPLTSIKGYLDMLLQGDMGKLAPTQRAVLREAFSSSERMVQLINDFLNVSRLQTGKFTINRQLVNLGDIIKEEVTLLRVVAEQRGIRLVTKIDRSVVVNIDADKVRQVVMNMIDNAIYYSKPKMTVTVTLKKTGEDVEFVVKDHGIGVPEAEQSGLFSKFFRGSNARKRRPDGTGVGLFLAKKVVLEHDGEMIFSSVENKGSVFGFRLPLRQPKEGSS